jgi:hypothetical protein
MPTILPGYMRQKVILTLSLVCVVLCLIVTAPFAYAETVIHLPAHVIPQRFSPADPNGDTGATDCMAAALTTSLLVLADNGNLALPRETLSYRDVRKLARTWAPDLRSGITPAVLIAATATITKGEYVLVQQSVDPLSWKTFLRNELTQSRPVIVHIPDRNLLYNPMSQSQLSHVIVVTGIDERTITFTDSWDGILHTIDHNAFGNAWGKGHYNWLAFVFSPRQR